MRRDAEDRWVEEDRWKMGAWCRWRFTHLYCITYPPCCACGSKTWSGVDDAVGSKIRCLSDGTDNIAMSYKDQGGGGGGTERKRGKITTMITTIS